MRTIIGRSILHLLDAIANVFTTGINLTLLSGMINMYLFKYNDGEEGRCGPGSLLYDNQVGSVYAF